MRTLPPLLQSRVPTALAILLSAAPALAAGPFEFVPAPQIDLNRVYRIDRSTGEVTSCQYGLREDSVGITLCFAAGEGAGAQAPGEYGLIASRHSRESGVFRVNYRTGEMSICYVQVREEAVVCTPQNNPGASGAAGPGAPAGVPLSTRASPGQTPSQGGRP